MAGLFKTGLVQGVRGQAWAVLSPGGKPPYRLISFGTLAEAVYAAAEKEPQHPLIRASIALGLQSAIVLHERTPSDVCRHLKNVNNSYHDGSGVQVSQLIQDVFRIQQEWSAHCKLHNLVFHYSAKNKKADDDKADDELEHDAGDYTKAYSTWLQKNHHSTFKTYDQFQWMKRFANELKRRDLVKDYEMFSASKSIHLTSG